MRKIIKTHPPAKFLQWLKENEELDRSYAALQGKDAHSALKKFLLREQGYLCAYTGRAIGDSDSHMEHIKPQTMCVDLEDVEYKNVLAGFPADGGDVSYGYGAPVKGGEWDEEKFISPCSDDCERRFKFSWKGKIREANSDDDSATYTIGLLKLDHDNLADLRHKAINGFFGFGKNLTPISAADAKSLLAKIDTPNSSGKFTAFCFAIKQLLPGYIKGP